MKTAIVLVVALIAAVQARTALKESDVYDALDNSASWRCAETKMQNIIKNVCGGVADTTCFEKGLTLVDDAVKSCFHKGLKQVATTDRSRGPFQLLGCIARASWELATGQPNPADALSCINDI